jgi:ABC-type uncharacterized transport system permease subunit
VIVGGGFSAMAGAHLSTSYSKSWIEGMTAGRGWIVIALTIFALWNPMRAMLGAFLFGGIFVLQYLLQPLGISPNFLAMLPYIATCWSCWWAGCGTAAASTPRPCWPSLIGGESARLTRHSNRNG